MSGVQSIERAFAVLRALSRGSLGVTEIAEQTDLPKSTVSRLLAALDAEGAVEQLEVGGEYSVGSALATLGAAASPRAGLRSVARPFIEELAMLTGGSAGFTIREGDSAYWVDNVDDGDELVTVADQTGQSFALHTIPSGIALLARLRDDDIDAYVTSPAAVGGDDPVDVDLLRRRIGRARVDGVVVSNEDIDPGVNAVACAFRGVDGEWAGALYLQGPSFRFPDDGDERRIATLVADAATQLSERLSSS